MSATMVKYRVKPDQAETNADLIRAVYAELGEGGFPHIRYSTWMLEDGVTFVHLAAVDGDERAPLSDVPAFRKFREGLRDRCETEPEFTQLTTKIGSYQTG